MAEYTNSNVQVVSSGSNVLFTSTIIKGKNCIKHREGSGLVTLRGLCCQCNARFLVQYSGNIAIPTGGTVGEISSTIAIDGEALNSSKMLTTPSAVSEYANISSSAYVDVPKGCCITLSIQNTSTQDINVSNPNLIVTRVA